MKRYPIPAGQPKRVDVTSEFRGVDYTTEAGNVSRDKSPYAPNMLRDVPGKVRKSMGWHVTDSFPGAINGRHKRLGDEGELIHAGTELYLYGPGKTRQKLCGDMADTRSRSWQLGGRLILLDGRELRLWDGKTLKTAAEEAYVPTLTIGKAPAGGGKPYEPLNLLQPRYTESFGADGTATAYRLSLAPIDAGSPVRVQLRRADGTWKEETGFTVDYAGAVVTFASAPAKSPVAGEDNVKITVSHTVPGYADRIRHCTVGALFGVGGVPDRLFLSGNPDESLLNYDWWSGQNDPTYWPDTGYGTVGSSGSAVVGYCQVQNYLAAFKDERDPQRSVVLRRGELLENEAAFPVQNTLQGPGACAPFSFAYLGREPLFLTPMGVFAITTSDVTGDKYQQGRSYCINAVLRAQPNLREAFAVIYHDMYWLCLNGQAFILDGMQSMTEPGAPYSARQYACFNRLNLPARVLWEDAGVLRFGTADGRLCAFYTDKRSTLSFSDGSWDDGSHPEQRVPIAAAWETPDLTGTGFYRNKSFRYLAIQQQGAVYTGVKLYGMRRGIWKLLRDEPYSARYLFFPELVFSKFTFSSDTTNRTLHTRTKLKKLDKTRFRFENDRLNEPFGLMSWAVEYLEGGNYKG